LLRIVRGLLLFGRDNVFGVRRANLKAFPKDGRPPARPKL